MSLSSPSASPAAPVLPRLTQAHAPLTHSVEVVNELGEREQVQIPAERPLTFVEDVGRHNAIDTIAGWMWMNTDGKVPQGGASSTLSGGTPAENAASESLHAPMSGADKVFYTTGRLTSEMVIKSAQMGVPIVVSRSGMTQMGHAVAQQLGLCAIGRATNRRFVCYSGTDRLVLQPELAQVPVVPVARGGAGTAS